MVADQANLASYVALPALPCDIGELADAARSEGFGMVHRLIDDYAAERNRFSKRGESLCAALVGDRTVAVGGINVDPYYDSPVLGRIRHLYVHPDFRHCGVGTGLMNLIESRGEQYFDSFQLFTTSRAAGWFYEALSYVPVQGRWKVSHAKNVRVAWRDRGRARLGDSSDRRRA